MGNTYLLEVFEFAREGNYKYFHLANSRIFKSNKDIEDGTCYRYNKYFVLSKII